MKKFSFGLLILMVMSFIGTANAASVDTVEFITGQPGTYFVDDESNTGASPYYRWYNEDWGWEHSAIAGTITTASLWISAWDVDVTEVDNIYVDNNGTQELLGSLTQGNSNYWGYTEFVLSATLFDDINSGLNVWMDIDATHSYNNWAVTLAKSVLTVDGGAPPNPNPGAPVPEPATMFLLGVGLLGLLGVKRKKQ